MEAKTVSSPILMMPMMRSQAETKTNLMRISNPKLPLAFGLEKQEPKLQLFRKWRNQQWRKLKNQKRRVTRKRIPWWQLMRDPQDILPVRLENYRPSRDPPNAKCQEWHTGACANVQSAPRNFKPSEDCENTKTNVTIPRRDHLNVPSAHLRIDSYCSNTSIFMKFGNIRPRWRSIARQVSSRLPDWIQRSNNLEVPSEARSQRSHEFQLKSFPSRL
jgi:hypothetical protein